MFHFVYILCSDLGQVQKYFIISVIKLSLFFMFYNIFRHFLLEMFVYVNYLFLFSGMKYKL